MLVGHSMGCHTAAAYALDNADALAGVVLVGPVTLGLPPPEEVLAHWDRLSAGLDAAGVDGFMEAYEADLHVEEGWRETVLRITRERISLHEDPKALAAALRELPRSIPFDGIAELGVHAVPGAGRGEPRRGRSRPPLRRRRGLVGRDSGRRAGRRGGGGEPARVAGRQALARGCRVLREPILGLVSIDEGHAIHYTAVERGTPVYSSDGVEVGKVEQVVDNYGEHILDGFVIETADGKTVFADAPEVATNGRAGRDAEHRRLRRRRAAPARQGRAELQAPTAVAGCRACSAAAGASAEPLANPVSPADHGVGVDLQTTSEVKPACRP